jgi:hypothetical protein
MSVKIKIKNKLEGTKKTNIGGLNWKEKIFNKSKNIYIKRMRAELKKIKQHKLWLNDEIENNKTLIKKSQENKIRNQKNKNRIKKQ